MTSYKPDTTIRVQYRYWFDGDWRTGISKVYRVGSRRFPSGTRKVYYIYNKDRKNCEWVKADSVTELP